MMNSAVDVFTHSGPTAEVEAHQFVTRYTEGFSHFVTSMTSPVASGWSDGRVGLAPTGKAPPYHGVSDIARDEVGLCLKSGIGASLTNEIHR